ncbi:MAG: hypothetical protein U5S82_14790 [Gammaproteobacteria bacterium]|nr:hypothetical protein [Gammaproteobacteria bacterium]
MTDYIPGTPQFRENERLKAALTAAAGRRLDTELDAYRPSGRRQDGLEALAHSLGHIFGLRVDEPQVPRHSP